jgi:2-octaprenyl-6-methoxyphenol hydroxylase
MDMKTFDIIIIGCGFNGLLSADYLSDLGLNICIVDKNTDLEAGFVKDQRTIALSSVSKSIFEELNIFQKIKDFGIIDYIYTFEKSTKPILEFSSKQNSGKPIGYIVRGYELMQKLYSAIAKKQNITIKTGFEISSLTHDNNFAFINGDIKARLALVCDGRNSFCAKLLNNTKYCLDYNQKALSFVIEHSGEHKNIATEQFTQHGPFATLPLSNPHQSGVVWSLNEPIASFVKSMPKQKLIAFVSEEIKRMQNLKSCTNVISDVKDYNLSISLLRHRNIGRFCFIGDAYNAIHPVAGQAFNMSLKDIIILKQELQKSISLGLDIGLQAGLSTVSISCIKHHAILNLSTHFLVKLYSNQSLCLKLLRTFGLGIFSELEFLKNLSVGIASGN